MVPEWLQLRRRPLSRIWFCAPQELASRVSGRPSAVIQEFPHCAFTQRQREFSARNDLLGVIVRMLDPYGADPGLGLRQGQTGGRGTQPNTVRHPQ